MGFNVEKSDAEWRAELSDFEYQVLRQAATERAFTGELLDEERTGIYSCKGCGVELFRSTTKFDSHCGWPSFYEPLNKGAIIYTPDNSHGMVRTEVQCGKCKSHLGHVFEDGPPPTGLRYCINGVVLAMEKTK
jgi:peptide-methionine (R)-S-oxide reductase